MFSLQVNLRQLFPRLPLFLLSLPSLNSSAPIVGRGDVRLDLCMFDRSVKPCLVKNVLPVPDLRYQLLSVSAISKLGVSE